MPSFELDPRLTRECDRVRSSAHLWQLRAAMEREHTADLMDENRQWQREARTLLECTQRLRRYSFLLRARAGRVGTA